MSTVLNGSKGVEWRGKVTSVWVTKISKGPSGNRWIFAGYYYL